MADEDQQDDQQQQGDKPAENPKDLRAAAEDGRRARAEAEAAKREMAFLRAGIDTESPKGKAFMKLYEDDLESEKIRQGFAELFGDAQPTTQNEVPVEEQRQTEARGALSNQAGVPGDGSPSPWAAAESRYKEIRDEGGREEIAFGAALSHIIGAANRGDQRVISPS